MILNADDLGDIVIRVHGPSLTKHTAIFEEAPVLGDRFDVILSVVFRFVTSIDVSLDPSVDAGIALVARKDHFATDDANDSRNVNGLNVIEDNRGLKPGASIGELIEDGGIPHESVDYRDCSNAFDGDVEPNLHAVDIDSLEVPSPVPSHFDGGVRTVYGDVSYSKLLISDVKTDVSAVNNEVAHKTTAEKSDSALDSENLNKRSNILPSVLHKEGTVPSAVRGR